MRILFIPCSHPESVWLCKALQESAHSVLRAEDLPDGKMLAAQETFDAIVVTGLDRQSHLDLIEALPSLSRGGGASVVAVIGQSSPAQRAQVLRSGADACFCQPFSFIELHERLRALERAHGSRGWKAQPAAAKLSLDPTTREFVAGSTRLDVTRREYLLLECLMRQFNSPVPREQLVRYAWPETEYVDPSSVNLVVSRLRRKLEGRAPQVRIETVNRYGYQIGVDGHAP